MTRKFNTLLLALLALIVGSPAALAQAAGLASYEATYRLTLGDIDYNGAIITAKGAMAMRVRRDCTRWQSHSEFLFILELDNGEKVRTHTMFRQRESLDGQNSDFVYWQELSDTGRLEYRGSATIPLNGEAGEAYYVKPKRYERKLPKGVEMPITAMRQIVEALITEGATPKHNYFDPRAKFVEIRSIGGEPIILAVPPKGDAGLVDGRSWRLRATPIPEGQEEEKEKDKQLREEEEENFTMIQIHDSGVASYMEMKSGITTINGELTEVRRLPPPNCNRPKQPELELSNDCDDATAIGKEEDVVEGAEKDVETENKAADDLAAAAAEDGDVAGMPNAMKDCDTFVERDDPGEIDDVDAAPVEDVEKEPVDDSVQLQEAETEEAPEPEIINASATN